MVGARVIVHGGVARLGALVVAAALVAGCSAGLPTSVNSKGPTSTSSRQHPSGFYGTLIDPPLDPPTETLHDTTGQGFSVASRPLDEVTVLFFGYTHCPDLCPTTMADLAAARNQMAPQLRDRVTVAFVTEDPGRDTPAALRRWLDRFDPSFVGLRGGNAASRAMLAHLYLTQTERVKNPRTPIKHPSPSASHDEHGSHHEHGRYGVAHAGEVYAFGPGDRTVVYTGGTTPDEYAADFARLLNAAQ